MSKCSRNRMAICPTVYIGITGASPIGSVCKLLDLEPRLLEMKSKRNAAAIVVQAHLEAIRTRGDMDLRKKARWRLIRGLYEQRWKRRDIVELYRLLDWLLTLPDDLLLEFRKEVREIEEVKNMRYITSTERLAREEGREEGRQEGRREGLEELLLRLARTKFPEFLPSDEVAVRRLSNDKLQRLAEALLNCSSIEDLRRWFD